MRIVEIDSGQVEALFPILLQAEPSERALRWGLANLVDAVYHIRRDYFWYYGAPPIENGLPARDLLVFRYALAGEEQL